MLLKEVQEKRAILIVGLDNGNIPDIHNFYPKKYYESIRHLGFGFFEGTTEHGDFSFDAGGAMRHHSFEDKTWLSWTSLRASYDVLNDLGYDFEKVETALQREIESLR